MLISSVNKNTSDSQDMIALKISQSTSEWNTAAIVNASNKKMISTQKKMYICYPNTTTSNRKVHIKKMSTNEWNSLALTNAMKSQK